MTTSVAEWHQRATTGNRRAVGRLLSLVERGGSEADAITDLTFNTLNNAPVIGITGAPGSGKSTLTGALVSLLASQGLKPAVLAVDPSSPLTGGAILGDRIRMDDRVYAATHNSDQSTHPFIRSMATRGHAGGLALAVPAAIRVFDVAGFSPIIIETVGIGQVEVDVAAVADTTMVVVTPEGGDSVQANKSGLLEVADVFVVNKADRPGADQTKRDLDLMLDLSHVSGHDEIVGWRPTILMTQATAADDDESQITGVWSAIQTHQEHLTQSGQLAVRRRERLRAEVRSRVEQSLLADLTGVLPAVDSPELDGTHSPLALARRVTDRFRSPGSPQSK